MSHTKEEAITSVKGEKCKTCGGEGIIGGFQSDPCPDCARVKGGAA